MTGAQFEIRNRPHAAHLSRSEGFCDGGGVVSEIPKSAQRCRSQGPQRVEGDGRRTTKPADGSRCALPALALGSTRTARTNRVLRRVDIGASIKE